MKKKEVIINGIDVTECEHRRTKECAAVWAAGGSHILHKVFCCDSPNCYYKQLKRKEQEYDTLKSENFTFEELVKYQDEQLEPFNDGYFEHLDTKMIADLAKKSIRLTTENRKLENVLDEIEKYLDAQQKYFDGEDYHNLLDIINRARENK